MATLPYVTASGNIDKAFKAIKSAATPESVSQDFVKTILGIPGGSGNQMTAYLKKIGFVSADGKPTDIYKKFRNSATEGWAAAQALKTGYGPLYVRNEYMHSLPDDQLRGLIVEETGVEKDSVVVSNVFGCIKQLKKFAKWSGAPEAQPINDATGVSPAITQNALPAVVTSQQLGFNLGYTINLNLPSTSDPAVFNAIFRALKENLLQVPIE